MIVLRNLSTTEFADYRAYFVADYAREIISNYAETPARAEAIARADMNKNFPAGVPAGANELVGIDWVVDEVSTHVGYLWYTIMDLSAQRLSVISIYWQHSEAAVMAG